jgi:hypothetical protein
MELPDDIILLVRDFTRPVTRPDWRTLHRMPAYRLHCSVRDTYNLFDIPVIDWFLVNYDEIHYTYFGHPIRVRLNLTL